MIQKNEHLSDEEAARIVAENRKHRTDDDDLVQPRAVKAWYDAERSLVMFQMRNGCVFGFPYAEGMGLENATPDQLSQVDVDLWGGEALHWEELDADISVPGLLFRLLNVRGWYAKWLGTATSEAKAAAARENGKKGGRPRTKAPAPGKTRRRNRITGGD